MDKNEPQFRDQELLSESKTTFILAVFLVGEGPENIFILSLLSTI